MLLLATLWSKQIAHCTEKIDPKEKGYAGCTLAGVILSELRGVKRLKPTTSDTPAVQDIPDNILILRYFNEFVPELMPHMYEVMEKCKDEANFERYYTI